MNIGIIGCGNIAQAHVKSLSILSQVKKIILFDVNKENIEKLLTLSERITQEAKSIKELALSSDAFIVCTPNNLHLKVIEEVLNYNKIPFLCEKPIASTLGESNKVLDIAPEKSIICFNYRFNYIISYIKSYVDSSNLGKCLYFSAEFNKDSALVRKNITWRDQSAQSLSSGALGDLSCHLLDTMCWITNSKINLNSISFTRGTRVKTKQGNKVEVDDNGYIFGHSIDETYFRIKASKSDESNLGLHFNIVFEKAEINYTTSHSDCIKVKRMNQVSEEIIKIDAKRKIEDPLRELPYWSDSFINIHEKWLDIMLHGEKHCLPTIKDGIHIQEVIDRLVA
ncbi:Gfo/Idh/MocA family protein [Zooshikella ganghwensis]|uniref:Gfo/Idh/MocA family oxidoreductase n=1 Tax=Zooshikella ganghwensis TaxID=202772 RepID=A0A4P9VEK4_9GAMM|nr:Gfo/Idh/MocA family oxidoreductase [Zooshikella ganghwensis]RDH41488.1 gfo/Idh/MocA family oxidoreductase [Zooshikella ganghwensis]